MRTNRGIRWTLGIVAALALAGAFAVTGWARDPVFGAKSSSLAPNPVEGGSDVLYTASATFQGNNTLTHGEWRITFPSTFTYAAPADPDVCTQTGTTATTITLTCDRGTIRPGDPPLTQAVRFTTPVVSGDTDFVVTAFFTYDDQSPSPNRGRADQIDVDPAKVTVKPALDDNFAAKCAAKAGETVATVGGVSATNALTTTMNVPATAALCSPVSLQEFPAGTQSVSFCPTRVKCTTEISVTSAPLFSIEEPITLIFEIYGKPKTWYKNGVPVLDCTGPGATPDPCISERMDMGNFTRLTVLWSGVDPSWEGA
jgi:hypothetical protein